MDDSHATDGFSVVQHFPSRLLKGLMASIWQRWQDTEKSGTLNVELYLDVMRGRMSIFNILISSSPGKEK